MLLTGQNRPIALCKKKIWVQGINLENMIHDFDKSLF